MASTLSVLYIDLMKHVVAPPVTHYVLADDIRLLMKINDERDTMLFQRALQDFCVCAARLGMCLSMHKCQTLHFDEKNPRFTSVLDDVEIDPEDAIRDLGVTVSENLTYRLHIENLVKRVSMMSSWIFRSFVLRKVSAYIRLYMSKILSLVLYCSSVSKFGDLGTKVVLTSFERLREDSFVV